MIVNQDHDRLISSTNVGECISFGIKDPVIIMETLAGLYSNQRKIICQEYMCNARDAHREVGKDDVPIHVTLPTRLDPQLIIKDFGPGLSESRIREVFTMFGESTKRGSNNETGGFGIGAKCAFAYTKAFFVETIVNGIKFTYSVLKDSGNGLPGMILMSQHETDESNGTSIIIPINEGDVYVIESNIRNVARYWSVKPYITNDHNDWDAIENPEFKGEGWSLYNYSHRGDHGYILLDEIVYPIPDTVLKTIDSKCQSIIRLPLLLHFKTGEIMPAVNRESIKETDHTIKIICDRIENIYTHLENHFSKMIEDAPNLYMAHAIFNNLDSKMSVKKFIKNVTYKGFKVNGNDLELPYDEKCICVYDIPKILNDKTISYKKTDKLVFYDKSLVLINDDTTSIPSRARIKTIAYQNPDFETIQVINIKDIHDQYWINVGLSLMDFPNISTYEPTRTPRSTKTVENIPCKIIKNTYNYLSSETVDIKNHSGVYTYLIRNKVHDEYNLKNISKAFNIDIICIPLSYKMKVERNKSLIELQTFLTNYCSNYINNHPYKKIFIESLNYNCYANTTYINIIKQIAEILGEGFSKTSIFRKVVTYCNLVNRVVARENKNDLNKFEFAHRNVNIRNICKSSYCNDLDDACKKIYQEYPLLSVINFNSIVANKDPIKKNEMITIVKNYIKTIS